MTTEYSASIPLPSAGIFLPRTSRFLPENEMEKRIVNYPIFYALPYDSKS